MKLSSFARIQSTIAGIAVLAACSAPVETSSATAEAVSAACPSGSNECPAWGATCSGSTLKTCVIDAQGCRKLIVESCSVGCGAGACTTCSTLAAPKRSSSQPTPTAFYGDIAISGHVAFVGSRERNGIYSGPKAAIATVDLQNPDALATLGSFALPDWANARQLRLDGTRLVALVGQGLEAFDASSPSSLVALGTYAPGSPALSLAVHDGVAYVGTQVGIDVVDVSHGAPTLISVFATTAPAIGLAVSGTRIAVAGDSAVEIIDAADPTSLALVANATLPSKIYGYGNGDVIAFDGVHAYVVASYFVGDDGLSELHVLELGTPTVRPTLTIVGTLRGLQAAESVALAEGDLAIETSEAVGTVDISDPRNPRWKKEVWVGEPVAAVARLGDTLYASGKNGLTAISLSREGTVALASSTSDALVGHAAVGSLAYDARSQRGLVIEDLRDPQTPVVLSQTALNATSLALAGSQAFVTTDDALEIFDVSSPWAPSLLGKTTISVPSGQSGLQQVSIEGNRAYAMCGIGSICIFDITDRAAPKLTTRADPIMALTSSQSSSTSFAILGHYIYVPTLDKLIVGDLSTPSAVAKIAEIPLSGGSRSDDIHMGVGTGRAVIAYACAGVGGHCIDVIDVSNPAAPSKLGSTTRQVAMNADAYQRFNGSNEIASVSVSDHEAFVSNAWGGVFAVDIRDPSHPVGLGDLWTVQPASETYVTGRYLTTHTVASIYAPGLAQGADQILELCQ